MTKQQKLIAVLTTAARKSKQPAKIKAKIRGIKKRQVLYEFLAR